MKDLNFIPSEDMIKELQSRFDELVLLGSTRMTSEAEDITVAFTGSYHACLGLLEIGKIAIQAGGSDDSDYSD